jgi:hypothetical protein
LSSIVAPNAMDWRERLQQGSAASVRMTGTARISWRYKSPCHSSTGCERYG